MFVAAAVQLTSTSDAERNWQDAQDLVMRAVARGARFVVTPENTNYLGPHEGLSGLPRSFMYAGAPRSAP